ncbi:MAG: hypothetical protein KME45_21480 [Stenomitos rutilans HA7619-LM2]|jgi:hypothetical protein|nr:hypothetical protein [Stenomitos rutilans HA7619-LM2]
MSEADSPNDQPDPASIVPSKQAPAVQAADEGWQTVDFPGAMSIDALPHSQALPPIQLPTFGEATKSGVIHYSSAELDPAIAPLAMIPVSSDTDQLQHLQEENATLRDRLAQAELDLVQHQIEWQLETACSQAETTGETAEVAHDRLRQLLQELERSQQTAQRQQILVETLTEQLKSSQERIAQLERDCALIQQRHNEQVQQVLQAESACRDLRLRLHRQQQQTLQFKAALEKCLEMPTVYTHQALSEALLDDGTTPHPLSALLKPKNQPVKPWSQPADVTQAGDDQSAMPKPLFRLLKHDGDSEQGSADLWQEDGDLAANSAVGGENQEHTIADPTHPSALPDSDDPQFVAYLMQLMFPDTVEERSYQEADALEADVSQTESIFALSPFLGADPSTDTPSSTDHQQASASSLPSEATAIVPEALPEDPSADQLWHNLAASIDPSSSVASSADVIPAVKHVTPVAATQSPSTRGGIPPLSTVSHPALPPAVAPVSAPPDQSGQAITAWTWRDRLSSSKKAPLVPVATRTNTIEADTDDPGTAESDVRNIVTENMAQRPSKFLSLSTLDRSSVVKQTISVASQPGLASASFATATPSPIVYPLRSSKKLASLAAVDLPTFPKR